MYEIVTYISNIYFKCLIILILYNGYKLNNVIEEYDVPKYNKNIVSTCTIQSNCSDLKEGGKE